MNHTKFKSFAESYIAFARKFRFALFAGALLLFIGCLYFISGNLKLNNDLSALLPSHTPSVLALKESNERFGSTDRFMIAIESDDPALIAKLQDEIKKDIDKNWKDLAVNTQVDRNNQFFEDHALLYLPVHHLERIRDNLVYLQKKISRNGLLTVDLLADEEEEKELVWFDASLPQELGLPDEAADSFKQFFTSKEEKEEQKTDTPKKEEFNPKSVLPDSLKTRLIGQNGGSKKISGVVIAKLMEPSTNLNFTEKILARSEELLKKYRSRTYKTPTRFSVEGTYEGLKDVEEMKSDGLVSTLISLVAIVALLLIFFRSIKATVILFSQVGFACILMLAFTALIYGQLNPFTLFVGAIIFGMGIDFSIHVIGTAQREFTERGDLDEALSETLVHLMRPMVLAAITTVAGLLTLLVADFKGFYEFGVIASAGIVFSLGTAILGLPVLIILLGGLPPKRAVSFFPTSWNDDKIAGFFKKSGRAILVASVLLLPFIQWAEFEHNMRNLRAAKKQTTTVQKGISTSSALSSNRKSSQPVAVFGDSKEELEILHDTLMHRMHVEKDPYLRSFLTLSTFVPPAGKQEERLEVIEDIADLINDESFDSMDEENEKLVKKLRHLVKFEDFTAEEIPRWALDLLREKDGSYGTIGFIYGSFESWNALDVGKFQDRYSNWNFGGKDLRSFSSSFIFSDVIRSVKSDAKKMSWVIALVLIITLLVSLRKFSHVLVCSLSLGVGVLLTVEMMGLLNLGFSVTKVGIYNVIVIPTLIGVGIDATIHLLSSYMSYQGNLKRVMDTTGRMVTASSLTTAAGFFGVLFISHKGMRTIGELAVLGIFCTLIAALILTPWFSKIFIKENKS